MEETKANKWENLEAKKLLAEQLKERDNELGKELNGLENEVPVIE